MGKYRILITAIMAVLAGALFLSGCAAPRGGEGQAQSTPQPAGTQKKFKALHVMSYHSPWEWTNMQFEGFKDALKGLDVEYRVYQMAAKNRSSAERLQHSGQEAAELIAGWRPDLIDRANFGTLCVVSVSGYEQGLAAGRIAREILIGDRNPASFPIQPTTRGQAAISLARAKELGLKIDSETLLSSKVFSAYGWQ